jgi:ABC-type lipoprotein export system ATPase subunit
MAASLSRFRIEGLHGRRTITVPFEDNRIILVGENGTGKSTVASIIYYFLTQQWRRIKDYKFDSLEAIINGLTVRLTHDDVETLLAQARLRPGHLRHRFPQRMVRDVYEAFSHSTHLFPELEGPIDRRLVHRISDELDIPTSAVREILSEMQESREKAPAHLVEAVKLLDSLQLGQFLYLPTYRRIEQDLKSIFRDEEIEEKVQEFRDRFRKRGRTTFIELVEFGMQDVEKTIQARMLQAKESVRTGLSNLTGTYLREVIGGLQGTYDVEVFKSIDPKEFQSGFARIDEAILPAADKKLLQSKISEIAEGYSFKSEDKVVAHFLSKLIVFFREQEANEVDVRDFVELCNAYLTGKRLVYDNVNYSISIRQPQTNEGEKEANDCLELKTLSSGEKQIVSLFSHLYLSGEHDYFVVIDEPELSLSVPWQQRFLPDIINTGRCTGIVAVTHSPFIWQNDLEPYVRSLTELTEPVNVVR